MKFDLFNLAQTASISFVNLIKYKIKLSNTNPQILV